MKRFSLFFSLFLILIGSQVSNAQISLAYTDTITCPTQPLTMCAALNGQPDPLSIDDKFSGIIDIGFPFKFYGNTYTQCVAYGNGLISFNLAYANAFGGWTWGAIQGGIANNAIFGNFMDWNLGVSGQLRYQKWGIPGQRRFALEWCKVPAFGCSSLLSTMQIILYEGTNVIEVHTTSCPPILGNCPSASGGYYGQIVQGVRNSTGTASVFPPNRDPVVSPNNWGLFGITNDGMSFVPNTSANGYDYIPVPYHPAYIIDSVNAATMQWFAEGQPNTVIGTGACVNVIADQDIHYYVVKYTGPAGCLDGNITTSDTVHVSFGSVANTINEEICAGETYPWVGGKLYYATGTYDTLMKTVKGCDSLATLNLLVNPLPDVALKGAKALGICDGSSTKLTLSNPEANVTYQWLRDGYPVSGETKSYIDASIGGKYSVVATTAKGCTKTSSEIALTVNPNPEATIQPLSNEIICAYDTLQIFAKQGPNYEYRWTPEKPFRVITGADIQKVKGVFIDPSTEVVLKVFNEFGCYDSDTAIVVTKPCCEVLIPNAFSPNGDLQNDYFKPMLQAGQILLNCKIFDRFGKLVYNNENLKLGWDGKYPDGTPAPNAVYMYYVKYTCADGKLYEKKESLTLIR